VDEDEFAVVPGLTATGVGSGDTVVAITTGSVEGTGAGVVSFTLSGAETGEVQPASRANAIRTITTIENEWCTILCLSLLRMPSNQYIISGQGIIKYTLLSSAVIHVPGIRYDQYLLFSSG